MIEDLSAAVQLAILEKAHRRAVEEVMQANIGDVERVSRVLAMEAEHLGLIEKLQAAQGCTTDPEHDLSQDPRPDPNKGESHV